MKSAAKNNADSKQHLDGLWMTGAYLANAMRMLERNGNKVVITDTSDGVTISIVGIRTATAVNGKLAFELTDTSALVVSA